MAEPFPVNACRACSSRKLGPAVGRGSETGPPRRQLAAIRPGAAVPQGCLSGLFQNSLQKPHFDPPDVEVISRGEAKEQSAGIRTVIQVQI